MIAQVRVGPAMAQSAGARFCGARQAGPAMFPDNVYRRALTNLADFVVPDTCDSPDLSVIIVSWNVRDLLRACRPRWPGHAAATEGPSLTVEVIVVDNASADGSGDGRG